MNEKTIKILGGVIAGFVIVIIILFLLSSCSKGSMTYEKLEKKMMKVAQDYFEKNEKELPSQDGDTKTYTLKKMISDGKIDELEELFDREDIKCDGNITVSNNGGYYLYTPYLNCGKDYETKYLKDKIIEDSLVESGAGLYEVKDEYIMKGEVKNNYISFDGETYRIIRINEDGSIRVIKQNGILKQVWDNRYNADFKSASGINEYTYNGLDSRIKENIEKYYKEEFDDSKKGYILSQTLCTGKRTKDDITKDGSTECSQKLENQPFGLIAIYEYMQASLDDDCNKLTDKVCKNYNWLATFETSFWTITANSEMSKQAYLISYNVSPANCNNSSSINVVFNFDPKLTYSTGTGTQEDPYVIVYEK